MKLNKTNVKIQREEKEKVGQRKRMFVKRKILSIT